MFRSIVLREIVRLALLLKSHSSIVFATFFIVRSI